MDFYEISASRDCLIFPIGSYDNASWNRSNAVKDAEILQKTFKSLNFTCKESLNI